MIEVLSEQKSNLEKKDFVYKFRLKEKKVTANLDLNFQYQKTESPRKFEFTVQIENEHGYFAGSVLFDSDELKAYKLTLNISDFSDCENSKLKEISDFIHLKIQDSVKVGEVV